MFIRSQQQYIGPWGSDEEAQQQSMRPKPVIKETVYKRDRASRQENLQKILKNELKRLMDSPQNVKKPTKSKSPSPKGKMSSVSALKKFKIKHGLIKEEQPPIISCFVRVPMVFTKQISFDQISQKAIERIRRMSQSRQDLSRMRPRTNSLTTSMSKSKPNPFSRKFFRSPVASKYRLVEMQHHYNFIRHKSKSRNRTINF